MAKKKVTTTAASVSSKEAFPMARLALQLEVPTAVANIPGSKVREEYWNSGQYPPRCDGGQYPPAGGGGGNVEVCLATGDPPHNITGVGPV
jgi:hypothetical protein